MSLNKATGLFCPWCRQMNDPYSMLYRDAGGQTGQGMRLKCSRGHSGDYNQIMNMRPDKQQLALTEKQPVGTVVQTVWAFPEALQALHQRYPQTLMTNLCSLITAIADGDSILIEGEHVREIRTIAAPDAHPVEKGRDVVGLARENATLRAAVNELQEKLKQAGSQQATVSAALPAGAMDLLLKLAQQAGLDASSLTQPVAAQSLIQPPAQLLSAFDYQEGMADPFEQPVALPGHPEPGSVRGIPVPSPGKPLR